MSDNSRTKRPQIMESLTESQLKELEFQASEGDKNEFVEIATNYGWDGDTVEIVWQWFEKTNSDSPSA